MIFFALVLSIFLLLLVLSPLYFGKGGKLAPASAELSIEKLEEMKTLILKQYIREEENAHKGIISKVGWARRQIFLTNRYVDYGRQLDHLNYLKRGN